MSADNKMASRGAKAAQMLQVVAAERVIPDSDERWQRLHEIVAEHSLLRGDFSLSSGRESSFLFQLRQTTLHPEGSSLIGDIIVGFMQVKKIRCVGGLELGAVPVVTSAAMASFRMGYPVSAFFVRKAAKLHGARELVDGHVKEGHEILAVDDVTTTGNSMMQAVTNIAEKHHCSVRWALSIVDREEGAKEHLGRFGINLVSIFRKSDFDI